VVYCASFNRHKIEELNAILEGHWRVEPASLLTPTAFWEETGETFHDNALIKARALKSLTDDAVIADDSGLEVAALDGRPGVFSARYAGAKATDEQNLLKLLHDLEKTPDGHRSARFVCAIAWISASGEEHCFQGSCDGVITRKPSGLGGFGYDPVFYVPSLSKTFAELTATEKNTISHRAIAVAKLQNFLSRETT